MVERDDLVLEIGCGDRKDYATSIGLDIRKTEKVDVIADARYLPFVDECFAVVYSSHTIEHFSHRETGSILTEWVRVLKQEGTIEIRCPDLRARALLFALRPSQANLRMIYGEQDYPQNYHMSGYSFGLIKHILETVGIGSIRRVVKGYRGVPFLPDSLHVRGKKPHANSVISTDPPSGR